MNRTLTPEEQAIEDEHLANLTPRELDEYRIHLAAGGKMACDFVLKPDAPVYEGLDIDLPDDLPPLELDPDAPRAQVAAEIIQSCEEMKHFISDFVQGMNSMGDALEKRYEDAASELGLEHVLRD